MLLQDAKPSARTRAAKLWSTLFYGHVHRPEDRDTVVKGDTMLARCYRASPWAYALLGSTMVALSARLRARRQPWKSSSGRTLSSGNNSKRLPAKLRLAAPGRG